MQLIKKIFFSTLILFVFLIKAKAQTISPEQIRDLYLNVGAFFIEKSKPLKSFVNQNSELFFTTLSVNEEGKVSNISIYSPDSSNNLFSNVLRKMKVDDFDSWSCLECKNTIICFPVLLISKYKSPEIRRILLKSIKTSKSLLLNQINSIIYLSAFQYFGPSQDY